MKRTFSSLGKAAIYFLILFLLQLIVPFVYAFAAIIVDLPTLLSSPDPFGAVSDLLVQTMLHDMGPILLLSNIAVIAVYLLTAPMRRRSLRSHLHLHPMDPRAILPLLLLGICANLGLSLLLELAPFPQSWWDSYTESASMVPSELSFLAVLCTSIIAPIAEELCFRGLMYTRLRNGMPAIVAALISSMVFGAVHGTWIWFFFAFPLGLLMTWLFCRFDSLWASILFHISFNGVNFLLHLVPEASFYPVSIAGLLLTAALCILLARMTRPKATSVDTTVL